MRVEVAVEETAEPEGGPELLLVCVVVGPLAKAIIRSMCSPKV